MEEENKKPRRNSNGKAPKIIVTRIGLDGRPILDDTNLSPEDKENLANGLLEALKEIKNRMENSSEEDSISDSTSNEFKKDYVEKRTKQELDMTSHEVERRRLFTLFDVVTNTKELLIQRIGEHGKADFQHNVDTDTIAAANNVIKLCLKQVYLWIEDNDINPIKPGKVKKSTNPDDITKTDLFKK